MNIHKALLIGIFAGIAFLVFLSSLVIVPEKGSAAPVSAEQNTMETPKIIVTSAPSKLSQPGAIPADCKVSPKYPAAVRQWCSLIQKYAAQNNLNPDLIAALILQESGGKPDAYSKSGAVGLMQVMPRDGIAASFMCSGKPCFANRPSTQELLDPQFNIEYGTRYLGGLVKKYGNIRDALKAYGPMDMGYRYADIVLMHLNRYR
ncbi:MAG TPA: transglycosylase SLT domain-containing protein [Anaerolineaceae bacterium]